MALLSSCIRFGALTACHVTRVGLVLKGAVQAVFGSGDNIETLSWVLLSLTSWLQLSFRHVGSHHHSDEREREGLHCV